MAFIKTQYETFFPAIAASKEAHYINNCFVFYTEDELGNITSTASLLIDNATGFSEEQLFKADIKQYRQRGLKCLQIGRFVINKNNENTCAKDYFKLFYQFSKRLKYDVVVGMIKQKDMAFHQRLLGVKVLCDNTHIDFGGEHFFGTAAWELDHLKSRFFKWIDCAPIEATH